MVALETGVQIGQNIGSPTGVDIGAEVVTQEAFVVKTQTVYPPEERIKTLTEWLEDGTLGPLTRRGLEELLNGLLEQEGLPTIPLSSEGAAGGTAEDPRMEAIRRYEAAISNPDTLMAVKRGLGASVVDLYESMGFPRDGALERVHNLITGK